MREIKFRGKRLDNGEWIYGPYSEFEHNEDKSHKHYVIIVAPLLEDPTLPILYEVNPETVGQFTGFEYKNGRKIYEGDYCRLINSGGWTGYGVVQFVDGCFELLFKEPLWDSSLRCYRQQDYLKCWIVNCAIEIIGNIHDNPELLDS